MNSKLALLLAVLLYLPVFAQNDCTDALTVCGNSGYQGLTATGFGTQELDNSNTCQSFENNSIWLRLPVKTGGTLGFILTPSNADISVDFDFFIFGPDVTCGNIGQAIRCSTTNPAAAGSANNHTGMNDTEADTAEGPGPLGNNFVQWLTVQAGETYFLVIDRPIGASDFSLEWTGTASFHDEVVFNNPNGISLDLSKCDNDTVDDQSTAFDLTANSTLMIGSQADVALSYHLDLNDVFTNTNPITNPEAFANTQNPQTIFMRMTNTVTGCFETETFQLEIINPITAGDPADLSLCDFDENGLQQFNLAQNDDAVKNGMPNTVVTYYASQFDAQNKNNPLPSVYQNQAPYTTQTIWARLENISGCFGFDLQSFNINIIPLPDIVYTLDIVDFQLNSNSITVEMPDLQDYQFSLDGLNFSDSPSFEGLPTGPYTVYIRAKNGCKMVSEEVVILSYPAFFSPNGDGINDTWRIPYLGLRPDAVVTVYDRFGKIVGGFSGASGWDGDFNGNKLPSTDYWFVIQLNNSRIIKGHFAMIR